MDFPRGDGGGFTFGAASTPGPPPDAVKVMAQRLVVVAAELCALGSRLEAAATVDWRSRAAAAFRADLLQSRLDLMAAGRSVEDVAVMVDRYSALLEAQEGAAWPGGGVR